MADIKSTWQLKNTAIKLSKHKTSNQRVRAQCNRHIIVCDDSCMNLSYRTVSPDKRNCMPLFILCRFRQRRWIMLLLETYPLSYLSPDIEQRIIIFVIYFQFIFQGSRHVPSVLNPILPIPTTAKVFLMNINYATWRSASTPIWFVKTLTL